MIIFYRLWKRFRFFCNYNGVLCVVIFVSDGLHAGQWSVACSDSCYWIAHDVRRMTRFKAILHHQSSCGLEVALPLTWKLHNLRYISCQYGDTGFDSAWTTKPFNVLVVGEYRARERGTWTLDVPNGLERAVLVSVARWCGPQCHHNHLSTSRDSLANLVCLRAPSQKDEMLSEINWFINVISLLKQIVRRGWCRLGWRDGFSTRLWIILDWWMASADEE